MLICAPIVPQCADTENPSNTFNFMQKPIVKEIQLDLKDKKIKEKYTIDK